MVEKKIQVLKVRDFNTLFSQGYTYFIGNNFIYYHSSNTSDISPSYLENQESMYFLAKLTSDSKFIEEGWETQEEYYTLHELYNEFFQYSSYTIEELKDLL
jgi:hypothetical protein